MITFNITKIKNEKQRTVIPNSPDSKLDNKKAKRIPRDTLSKCRGESRDSCLREPSK